MELIEGFAEVDMGAFANPETPEARAERDAIFSAWLTGDRSRPFPGGEDFSAVVRRVREGLRAIFGAAPCARVAIVTHRMPIAAATALCEPGGAPGTPTQSPSTARRLTRVKVVGRRTRYRLGHGIGRFRQTKA